MPGVPGAPDAAKKRRNRIIVIVIAAIAAVALAVTGVVVAVNQTQARKEAEAAFAQADARAKAEAERRERAERKAERQEKKDQQEEERNRQLDTATLDRIVDSYSSTDAGVAVMTGGNSPAYSSPGGSSQFIAAGLYLPLYLASPKTPTPSDSAGEMMRSMNNEAANGLIDAEGGLGGLNQWLADHRYSGTYFGRKFGDVTASDEGQENYSTPDDAARMLMAVAKDGGDQLMNVDLAAEGVAIPQDVTVHAHRGSGIQDAYNYFIVMSDGDQKVAVAVMTRGLGQANAAQLTSDVLANVAQSLFWEE
ncbi:serine hydrolase [Bifidobacterium pullorum]|nr:serine hydrolase [Bifidobacterium pullorum]